MNMPVGAASNTSRRAKLSAIAPAKMPISMIGIVALACTSAMNRCDGVSSVISQPAPTAWIVEPMFEARLAIQIARNAGKRKGARADGAGERSILTPQRVAVVVPDGKSGRTEG